jgi:hypothetical protein
VNNYSGISSCILSFPQYASSVFDVILSYPYPAVSRGTLNRLWAEKALLPKQVFYFHFAGQTVHVKIRINAYNGPDAGLPGGYDEGGVGEVHGQVLVFARQFDNKGYIFRQRFMQNDAFVHNPGKKIKLNVYAKVQHVRHFRKDGGCGDKLVASRLYEFFHGFMVFVVSVKQGDKRAGVNEDVCHGVFLLRAFCM